MPVFEKIDKKKCIIISYIKEEKQTDTYKK